MNEIMLVWSLLSASTMKCSTHIWFVVRVPVLSEQIMVVQPRVSTLGSFLIMAFFLAIFLEPKASAVVITMERPSGIAATANETAILK